MYLSIHKIKSHFGHHIVAHVMSSLPADYPQRVQDYLDAGQDPDCEFYDPGFSWDEAQVVVLYHGLKEEREEWTFRLPDGRDARMWNINLGCTNRMAEAMKDYAAAMDLARAALLTGDTPEQAARKLWKFCELNDIVPALTGNPAKFSEVLKEMKEYSVILAEDLQKMGGWSETPHGLRS